MTDHPSIDSQCETSKDIPGEGSGGNSEDKLGERSTITASEPMNISEDGTNAVIGESENNKFLTFMPPGYEYDTKTWKVDKSETYIGAHPFPIVAKFCVNVEL